LITRLMLSIAPGTIPRLDSVHMDWQVFFVSAILAVATGILFGSVPAWQASRARPGESLKSTERGAGKSQIRWGTLLTIAEISLSMVLLVGAGLLLKSFVTVLGVNLGFQPEHVLAMTINLPEIRYRSATQRLQFFEQLQSRVQSLPGVESAAFANRMPMRGGWGGGVMADTGSDTVHDVDLQAVSTGYFDTLGIQLLRGRELTADDREGQTYVAVVNQAFAREFFSTADPIGHRFRQSVQAPWITIVGIVNNIRRGGKTADIRPQAYLPAAQMEIYPVHLADFAVRTAADPRRRTNDIQRLVWAMDKELPVTNVRTMDEIVSASVAQRRFQTLLLAVFAFVALGLAVIGIFGVLSYAVTQRTAELGIRMALGAQPKQVIALVLRQASFLIFAGVLLGIMGAFALTRYVQSLLFGVQSHDVSTYVLAAALLAAVALSAAFIPARRGARIDPMRALHYE
jgi:putative ABC transport system permease protein